MTTLTVAEKTEKLRAAVRLLTETSEKVIKAWEVDAVATPVDGDGSPVPSKELYEGRRVIAGTIGVLLELVPDPSARLMEITHEFYEARALQIAAEARIADILAEGDPKVGIPIDALSQKTGVKDHKLGEFASIISILRRLSSCDVQRAFCACCALSIYFPRSPRTISPTTTSVKSSSRTNH